MPGERPAPSPGDDTQSEGLRLFRLAQALGQALSSDEVGQAAAEQILGDFDASTVGFWLVGDDDVIRFAGGAGYEKAGGPTDVGLIPMDADLPAAIAVRTGELVSYGSVAERDEKWPLLIGFTRAAQAVAVVPLVARGRRIGCVHIGWRERRDNFEGDVPLLWVLGSLCASAFDRSRLYEGERRARETLEFLNQGTRIMISALEPSVVLDSLVKLAVPWLAPWCAVYVAEGHHLVRVAIDVSHDADLAGDLKSAVRVPLDHDVPLTRVYRSGQQLFIPAITPEMVHLAQERGNAGRVLNLGERRWAGFVLPVRAGGEVLGVMSLLSPGWPLRAPAEITYAAEGLAARAGVALANARRFRDQVDMVRLLTGLLLPEAVPVINGLTVAARYVPAFGGVCGDWFEADELGDGRLLIGIGDVAGHGLEAAATMARLRHAARGLAVTGMGPGAMLEHLSLLLGAKHGSSIATSLYGLFDVARGAGVWANAGHPPPIVSSPDGKAETVTLAPGPPIGVDGSRPEARLALRPGGRLVLYTDGIFERRGENPERGIARLAQLVARTAGEPPERAADQLIDLRTGRDDACLLLIDRAG